MPDLSNLFGEHEQLTKMAEKAWTGAPAPVFWTMNEGDLDFDESIRHFGKAQAEIQEPETTPFDAYIDQETGQAIDFVDESLNGGPPAEDDFAEDILNEVNNEELYDLSNLFGEALMEFPPAEFDMPVPDIGSPVRYIEEPPPDIDPELVKVRRILNVLIGEPTPKVLAEIVGAVATSYLTWDQVLWWLSQSPGLSADTKQVVTDAAIADLQKEETGASLRLGAGDTPVTEVPEVPGSTAEEKALFRAVEEDPRAAAGQGVESGRDVLGERLGGKDLSSMKANLRHVFFPVIYKEKGWEQATYEELDALNYQSQLLFMLENSETAFQDIGGYANERKAYEKGGYAAKDRPALETNYEEWLGGYLDRPFEKRLGSDYFDLVKEVASLLVQPDPPPRMPLELTEAEAARGKEKMSGDRRRRRIKALFGNPDDAASQNDRDELVIMGLTRGTKGLWANKIRVAAQHQMRKYRDMGWAENDIFYHMTKGMQKPEKAPTREMATDFQRM